MIGINCVSTRFYLKVFHRYRDFDRRMYATAVLFIYGCLLHVRTFICLCIVPKVISFVFPVVVHFLVVAWIVCGYATYIMKEKWCIMRDEQRRATRRRTKGCERAGPLSNPLIHTCGKKQPAWALQPTTAAKKQINSEYKNKHRHMNYIPKEGRPPTPLIL